MLSLAEQSSLAAAAVDEIIAAQNQPPLLATGKVGLVWPLSAPGTWEEWANDGAYSGTSFDRLVIQGGIDVVRHITAERLQTTPEAVTPEDISAVGPALFYNGEDFSTRGQKYHQNMDLRIAARRPCFAIPLDKLVIGQIPAVGTHTQVKCFAAYLEESRYQGQVAVVSLASHSARVGRYLQHYRALLPEGVRLMNTPIALDHNPLGIISREVRKIIQYANTGQLATQSYFSTE
jgi:hypothetical protein